MMRNEESNEEWSFDSLAGVITLIYIFALRVSPMHACSNLYSLTNK